MSGTEVLLLRTLGARKREINSMCLSVCLHACVFEDQRSASHVLLQELSTLFLDAGSLAESGTLSRLG